MQYADLKRKNPEKKASGKKNRKYYYLAAVVGALALFVIFFGDIAKAVFDPISVVATVSGVDLKETDGRTNILLLGSDRRSSGLHTGVLTDTILVASLGRVDKNIALISIPRDLWVEYAPGKESRINEIYSKKTDGGIAGLRSVVEDVLGIPLHYHLILDFGLFTEVVDTLGGVQVDVETSFKDYEYPIEGKENDLCGRTAEEIEEDPEDMFLTKKYPCRYETLSFQVGDQLMDGATALKYVRSRKGTNGEGTDFARSRRQQKVIMAIKDKMTSVETLINPKRLKELYDSYQANVDTDIDFPTIQQFYLLSQQIDFAGLRTVVLDDRSTAESGGLLYSPVNNILYDGRYVLIPRAGDYSQIRAFVQKYLFEY